MGIEDRWQVRHPRIGLLVGRKLVSAYFPLRLGEDGTGRADQARGNWDGIPRVDDNSIMISTAIKEWHRPHFDAIINTRSFLVVKVSVSLP